MRLRTYSEEPITVLRTMNADVRYKEQNAQLPLLVVQGDGPSLLGRSWLECLRLDWHDILSMRDDPLQALLTHHAAVFRNELGELRGFEAMLNHGFARRDRCLMRYGTK